MLAESAAVKHQWVPPATGACQEESVRPGAPTKAKSSTTNGSPVAVGRNSEALPNEAPEVRQEECEGEGQEGIPSAAWDGPRSRSSPSCSSFSWDLKKNMFISSFQAKNRCSFGKFMDFGLQVSKPKPE